MQKTKTKMSHSRAKAAKGEPRKKWQLQMAKARFSELFRCARSEGPQLITRQGKEGVVMISEEKYDQTSGQVLSAEKPRAILPRIAFGGRRARFGEGKR
jgi:prevent-host-death family protein